jgi:type IV secretory pathway TraG/TraD family ATPase VirD4
MTSAYLKEKDRRRHTYITGASGSGKSELIKHLVYTYVKRADYCGLIVLDPHGDLAEQIVAWKEFHGNDRLIYVSPSLQHGFYPVINPFEISAKNTDIASQEIAGVFRELLQGAGLTMQMETLLVPCISTVIRIGGTLKDLQRFMLDDMNQDLIAKGLNSPSSGHRDFFEMGFRSNSYRETKRSIYTKIQSLLNTESFYQMTIVKSTVDLAKALNQRKVIIFNLAPGTIGRDAASAFGRLIIALLQSLALMRANLPPSERVPVHVFLDECQLFITESIESILTGGRKYGIHLTLAQQVLGQDMTPQLRRIVLGNTAIKFTGKNGLNTLQAIGKEIGEELEELQNLQTGCFSLKSGDSPSCTIAIPKTLLGESNRMSQNAWHEIKTKQINRYYREVKSPSSEKRQSEKNVTMRKPKYD